MVSTKSVTAMALGSPRHFASAVASSVEQDARHSRTFSVKRDFFVEETKERVLGEVKMRLRDVEEVDVNIRSIWWLRMLGNNSKQSSLIRSSNAIYETILSHVSQPHILPSKFSSFSPLLSSCLHSSSGLLSPGLLSISCVISRSGDHPTLPAFLL